MYSPSSEDDSSALDCDWLSASERGAVIRISGISTTTGCGNGISFAGGQTTTSAKYSLLIPCSCVMSVLRFSTESTVRVHVSTLISLRCFFDLHRLYEYVADRNKTRKILY
jgi:hypothetical protein